MKTLCLSWAWVKSLFFLDYYILFIYVLGKVSLSICFVFSLLDFLSCERWVWNYHRFAVYYLRLLILDWKVVFWFICLGTTILGVSVEFTSFFKKRRIKCKASVQWVIFLRLNVLLDYYILFYFVFEFWVLEYSLYW